MATRKPTSSARARRAPSAPRRRTHRGSSTLHQSKATGAQIGNVAGLGSGSSLGGGKASSGRVRTRSHHAESRSGRHAGPVAASPLRTVGAHTSNRTGASGDRGGGPVITRRHLVVGAVGIGALAAVGGGAYALSQQNAETDDIATLDVPESAVTSSNDLGDAAPAEEHMQLAGNFELTYGTLVFASCDTLACCLIPSEIANPLCTVGILWLDSGNLTTVLSSPLGQAEGFQIYDARANEHGLVWVEEDILENTWRVYSAALSAEGALGVPALMEEGGGDWETPSIAVAGSRAFWQVMPKEDSDSSGENSLLKAAGFGSTDVRTIWSSTGRFATAPYTCVDSVVVTPRADTTGAYYQLTRIDADSGNATDTLVLPSRMTPLEAAFGENGFMFSFDAIYNYGGGIANLGTYCPMQNAQGSDYSSVPWFRFARTPSAAPAWCGDYLMVKSSNSVCGIDLASGTWFSLGVENGADDYGDYLASTGIAGSIVTFSNIDHTPLNGSHIHCCQVRVWQPL